MDEDRELRVPASQSLEMGTLFGIAIEAAREIKAPPRRGGQRQALVSIVFSVVALEAFMNEMTEYAERVCSYQPAAEGPATTLFAQVMGDAEDGHARLESKFALAKWILAGRSIDRGSQPHQDFALLVRVRNDLVHTKGNKPFDVSTALHELYHPLLDKFKMMNVLAEGAGTGSWTYSVQTRAFAEWACRTVAAVVNDLCDGLPETNFVYLLKQVNQVFQSHLATLV